MTKTDQNWNKTGPQMSKDKTDLPLPLTYHGLKISLTKMNTNIRNYEQNRKMSKI